MAANTISPVSDNSIQLIDFLPRFDKNHSAYYFETSPVEEWSEFFVATYVVPHHPLLLL